MTLGEQFVESLPRKTRFYDRNERRSYALTRAIAARLIDDPALVESGLAYARRYMSNDPAQTRHFAMWQEQLRHNVVDIVRNLLEDSPRGNLLRDTQPVFCVLPDEVRREIIKRAGTEGGTVTV
ncbi:MAG TPA: hypothetical protein VK438_10280 [Xanthobacteraceae bacterium]|nr:hypothetical protein [Xanthobacteraceae bacterium]